MNIVAKHCLTDKWTSLLSIASQMHNYQLHVSYKWNKNRKSKLLPDENLFVYRVYQHCHTVASLPSLFMSDCQTGSCLHLDSFIWCHRDWESESRCNSSLDCSVAYLWAEKLYRSSLTASWQDESIFIRTYPWLS